MARNPAARKAAKAIRRKAVVAAKRSVDAAANGLGGRVRQAATLPVLECLVSDGLFEHGMGTVTLIRGASRAYQHTAVFILDSFCLGVKDVFFRDLDQREAEQVLGGLQASDPASSIAPAEARKLLHDVVAWARQGGFPPHKDYARTEALFGDVVPAETDYTPRFGHEGKVIYVPGPTETSAQIRQRMRTVRSFQGDAVAARTILALASILTDKAGFDADEDEYEWEDGESVDAD